MPPWSSALERVVATACGRAPGALLSLCGRRPSRAARPHGRTMTRGSRLWGHKCRHVFFEMRPLSVSLSRALRSVAATAGQEVGAGRGRGRASPPSTPSDDDSARCGRRATQSLSIVASPRACAHIHLRQGCEFVVNPSGHRSRARCDPLSSVVSSRIRFKTSCKSGYLE